MSQHPEGARNATENSMTEQQTYRVGTSADDGWQPGVPPYKFKAISAMVGGNCQNYYASSTSPFTVLSAGYRFEGVQLGRGDTVLEARLSLSFHNSFVGVVTDFISPICVELSADPNDFVLQPDIINRPRTAHVDWKAQPTNALAGPAAYTPSPNLAPMVNEVLALPTRRLGDALAVIVFGEVYAPGSPEEDEYAHAYGWSASSWDCHDGLPPMLELTVA
jgi:hypothetical protein